MIVGKRPGIGKWPGIGKVSGILGHPFTMDMLVIRKNVTKTFTCDMRVCTIKTGPSFTMDAHVLTGTYTKSFTMDTIIDPRRLLFTMDAIIIKTWEDKFFTFDARIAQTKIKQFTLNANVAKPTTKSFTLDGYVIKIDATKSFTIDTRVATIKTNTFTTDSHIAIKGLTKSFTLDTHIMKTYTGGEFTVDMNVALFKTKSFTMDAIIFKYPKYILNGYDITDHIKQPDIQGLTKKINKYTAPLQIISSIIDMGTEALSYSFEVKFTHDHDYDTFLTAANSDTRDVIFYPGRDDVYHKVKSVSVKPTFTFHGKEYRAQVTLDLEDPYLYSTHTYEHSQLTVSTNPGFTTRPFINEGSVRSPFEFVEITGRYIGDHLKNVNIDIMNGSTVEMTMPISNKLLTDETASLGVYGQLTCWYEDYYENNTQYIHDTYATSGVTWAYGKLTVASGGYVTYKFFGPHPTVQNILLTSQIKVLSGSPRIEVSTDNSTWTTAVRADQIVNNVEYDYYLNGSEKLGDLYIRFYCPTGASIEIKGVYFEALRDATFYEVPSIPPWEIRTLRIRGDGSGVAGIYCLFRARKWP